MKKHSPMAGKAKSGISVVKKSTFMNEKSRKGPEFVEPVDGIKLESPSTVGRENKTRNKMTLKSTANLGQHKFGFGEGGAESGFFFQNKMDLEEAHAIWMEQSEKMSAQINLLQLQNEVLKRRIKGGTELTEEEKKKNATISEQNEKITNLSVENGELKLKYNCLQKEFEDYQQIIADKIGEDDEELRIELKQKEQKIAEMESIQVSLEQKNKTLLEQYEKLKKEKEAKEQDIDENQVAFLVRSCKEYETTSKEQEDKILHLEDNLRFLQENNEDLQNQVNEWKFIADKYNQQIESAEKAKRLWPGMDISSSESLHPQTINLEVPTSRLDSLQRNLEEIQEQLQESYEYSLAEDRKRRSEIGSLIQYQNVCQESLIESVNFLKSIEQNISLEHPLDFGGCDEEIKPMAIIDSVENSSFENLHIRQSTKEAPLESSEAMTKSSFGVKVLPQISTEINGKKSSKIVSSILSTKPRDFQKELERHKIKAFSKNLALSWESLQFIREAGAAASSRLNSLFSQF